MAKKIFIHGSGHKASSWEITVSYMKDRENILCPNLFYILKGSKADYNNLYSSFAEYCNRIEGGLHLCGISLGGILALNYAIDSPNKVKTLVLIGTPHKVPRVAFAIQNLAFRFLPENYFKNTEFSKNDMFDLAGSMKKIDFTGKVENINCPTLVICGGKDRANIKSAYYLAESIKDSQLKIVDDIGHVVNEEAPMELAKILTEYYSDHI